MARILLLEDNRDMLYAFQEALEIHGHEVVCGVDGREGMVILEEAEIPPDILITDLKMPHIGGQEIVEAVKRSPELRQILVIVMSGSPLDEKQVLSVGADAFILKPFKYQDLENLISELNRR